MYSTVIYDLDGTLVDSAATVTALLNGLRAECDQPPLAREALTPWLSVGGKALIAAALAIPETSAQPYLDTFRSRYQTLPSDPKTLYPEVHQTLATLKAAGIRLGLCTNKPRPLADKLLNELGLAEYFDATCAGNDLPTTKPHPDNLRACLQALGSHAEESVVVGDSKVDQALAQACGSAFAFFRGGYDDGVDTDACTLTLHGHRDIIGLLLPSQKRPQRE